MHITFFIMSPSISTLNMNDGNLVYVGKVIRTPVLTLCPPLLQAIVCYSKMYRLWTITQIDAVDGIHKA